jgi:hypothetical protein
VIRDAVFLVWKDEEWKEKSSFSYRIIWRIERRVSGENEC